MVKFSIYIVTFLLSGSVVFAQKTVVIDLSKQEAYAYEDGNLVMSGEVSTGKVGHRTPTGNFRIIEKDRRHVSSKYPKPNGGARMDYMMRLTNNGIAMHLGYVPNYPASHGCIRLKNGFAQKVYRWASVGTKVVIEGKAPVRVSRKRKAKGRKKLANYAPAPTPPAEIIYRRIENPKAYRRGYRRDDIRRRMVILDDMQQSSSRYSRGRGVYKKRRASKERYVYFKHNGKTYKRRVVSYEDTPSSHYVYDPYIRGVKVRSRY